MEKTEIQDVSPATLQREPANDVAMLFSWAKMESTPYRDFSRQRKPPQKDAGDNNTSQEPVTSTATVSSPILEPASISAASPVSPSVPASVPHRPPITMHTSSGRESPVVAVYSVAGGVGKTTLSANLGKILCSLGEQPLLVDVSSRGLLPFYFGATEARAGSRKFVAPGENAPFVQVMTAEQVTNEWLEGEVKHAMSSAQRTIFDLGPLCGSLLPAIFRMCTVVLVPLLPDLNSIVTVAAIENLLHAQAAGPKPAVYYLFNRFDEHKINDQHARDLVARQCGQRLLPITLRHDWKLTETLHGDLSTADHTPGPELSHDYLELALWVRRVAPVSTGVLLPGRWSEQ
jgi:cellulose biosynthesis protein BcsQ